MKAQNLIQNGSFENYANIDCSTGVFDNTSNFPITHVVDNWYALNSPDYFNNICSSGWYNSPNSIFGYCSPHQGNALVGFMQFYTQSDVREYIYQHLSSPLQSGIVYCLSFYVSRADRKEYAIKKIGAYFSNNIQSTGSIGYINAAPQVENQSGFITDTIGWTHVEECFIANGGEQYITIGNFNSNNNTDTLFVGTNNPIPSDPEYAYYYIDDISLIDQTTVGVTELNNNNSIEVYPNPASNLLQVNVPREYANCEAGIYNAIGELVLSKQITSNHSTINIENLQNGIYYYRILVNGKSIKNDKIIVIK